MCITLQFEWPKGGRGNGSGVKKPVSQSPIGIDLGPVSAGIMGKKQRPGSRNTAGPASSTSAIAPG